METAKVIIDGQEIEVPRNYALIQACEEAGREIPRFCYHERLSIAGNCRMCLVEVKGAPKPQASCAMRVADLRPGPNGEPPEILTDSPVVHKARTGVMEFLLANHPLDCPICDQGGECDLQDQAMAYGSDRSRFEMTKRAVEEKDFGPFIKTEMTRCIHCTRCVRFSAEVAGTSDLGAIGRGEDTEITPYIEQVVTSELSGNVIDLCPVGALTSKPYAFIARPWELKKTQSYDVTDAVGSAITVAARGNEVLRVTPRNEDAVNEEWISDKARFIAHGLKRRRLDKAYIRQNGALKPVDLKTALDLTTEKVKEAGEGAAFLAGPYSDIETLFAAKKFGSALGVKTFESRLSGFFLPLSDKALWRFTPCFEAVESADVIVIVGSDPRKEAAVLNARIRKAWLAGGVKIALIGKPVDLTYPYTAIGGGYAELEATLKGESLCAELLKNAKNPMMIVGEGALTGEDAPLILSLIDEICEKYEIVTETRNNFAFLPASASIVGAAEVDFAQSGAKTLGTIYKNVETGDLNLIYALGADNLNFTRLKKAFKIYQGSHGDLGAENADIILPAAAVTEKDGTYLNAEGRIRRTVRACFAPGDALADYELFNRLLKTASGETMYGVLPELRSQILMEIPAFNQKSEVIRHDYKGFSADFVNGETVRKTAEFTSVVQDYFTDSALTRSSPPLRERQKLQIGDKAALEAA